MIDAEDSRFYRRVENQASRLRPKKARASVPERVNALNPWIGVRLTTAETPSIFDYRQEMGNTSGVSSKASKSNALCVYFQK